MRENEQRALVIEQDWQLDVEQDATSSDTVAQTQTVQALTQTSTDEAALPLSRIVEGLLFVADEPIAPERICQIIRGLTSEHYLETVQQLNQEYRRQNRPYRIDRDGAGFRLRLRSSFRNTLDKLYGGMKEARFSPAAVETLAVIAYRRPISKTNLDAIRGQASDGPLRQLVRRGLVALQGKDEQNQPLFGITRRFLEFLHLRNLDELPRADDLERI